MEQLIQKYTEQLAVLKENRANTVDTNTDAENEQYDRLIQQVAGFIRELKQLNLPVVIASFLEDKAKQHNVEPNKVMIGLNYGELRLERCDEGAYEKWKVLEIIKPRF